jgi:hypothetical protein
MNVSSLNTALMPPNMLSDYEQREADGNRWSRYRRYLDFYNGRQWEERPRPGERRIAVNYARAFVLKGASYLWGQGATFSLVPNGSDPQAEAVARSCEEYLRTVWSDNALELLDFDAAVDAAVLGDGAFKVTLQPQGDAGPLDLALGVEEAQTTKNKKIVVANCDVMGLSAKWRGDDMRRLLSVTETWRTTYYEAVELFGAKALAQINLGHNLKDDALLTVREYWDDVRFEVAINNQVVLEQANPYGFVPYLIFPNLRRPRQFWGESDLVDIMQLNSELNVRVSTLSQILQLSGNPILVLENVEEANGLRVGPGAVWALPENSKAYLLDLLKDGGLDLHIQYIEALYRMLHDLSEMPRTSFGDHASASSGGGGGHSSSGVALELMLQPLVQKILRKRQVWNEMLDRRNRMILRLAGLPIHRTHVEWSPILPKDRAQLVADEVALVGAAIHSREMAAANLGDEQPDQILRQVLEEAHRFNSTKNT